MATAPDGHVYVGGLYGQEGAATRRFGSVGAVGPGWGGFVAQASAAGNWTWVTDVVASPTTASSGGAAFVTGVAVGANGEVYATGYASGKTLRVGTKQQPLAADRNLFVARLSPTGVCQWVRVVQNILAIRTLPTGAAIAPDASTGGVVVSGNYEAGFRVGNTALPTPQSSEGLFVARLDSSGNWQSAVGVTGTGIPTSGSQVPSWSAGRVVVGPHGQVAVVGSQSPGSLVFGQTTLSVPAGANGGLFVAQLSPTNTWEWAVGASVATAGSNSEVVGAAYTPTGQLWVSGLGSAGTIIGSLPLEAPGTRAGWHFAGFIGQLSPTGRWGIVRQLSPSAEGWVQLASVGVDGNGNAVAFGILAGPTAPVYTSVNGQMLTVAPGHVQTFAAALSPAGKWLYAAPLAQPTVENGLRTNAGVLAADGAFYLTGGLIGDLVVGRTQLTATDPRSANNFGAGDAVLLRLAHAGAPARTIITGDSVLCGSGAVTLTATPSSPALSYAWNTGATTASITVRQPGTYSLRTTFAGGLTSTSQYVVQLVTPTVAITGDTMLCPGATLTLAATGNPAATAYRWNTGATTPTLAVSQPGTYELTVWFGSGCTARVTRRVRAASLRVDAPALLCDGAANLTAVAPGATAFRWSTGATSPTLTVTHAGTFTVTATFANGCTLTSSHTVAAPVVHLSGDSLVCPGASAVLTAALPGATAYRWNTGATTPTLTVTQAGTYHVNVSYGGTCTTTAKQLVRTVGALPAFTLGADTTLCDQDSLVLRAPALAAEAGPVSYRWSTGSMAPTQAVQLPGRYTLTLTTACETRTASRLVSSRPCVVIPNIITPNGDGLNDVFTVRGLPPGPWALTIYNRWGVEVYHARDYHNDWGAGVPPGQYYYLLQPTRQGTVYKGWIQAAQ